MACEESETSNRLSALTEPCQPNQRCQHARWDLAFRIIHHAARYPFGRRTVQVIHVFVRSTRNKSSHVENKRENGSEKRECTRDLLWLGDQHKGSRLNETYFQNLYCLTSDQYTDRMMKKNKGNEHVSWTLCKGEDVGTQDTPALAYTHEHRYPSGPFALGSQIVRNWAFS